MNQTIALLKKLLHSRRITKQQFRVFKGQVLAGDEAGCLKGLKRMNLI